MKKDRPIWKKGDGWVQYEPPRHHPCYEEWVKRKEKEDERKIEQAVKEVFSFKPAQIVSQLDLLRPIYRGTTHYGHFGKAGLPWEETSKADALKQAL